MNTKRPAIEQTKFFDEFNEFKKLLNKQIWLTLNICLPSFWRLMHTGPNWPRI